MRVESKSFYAGEVVDFLDADSESILGKLSTRIGMIHQGDEREQIKAWKKQIEILKEALSAQNDTTRWQIFIEMPLQRLTRRIDTVLKIGESIACVEFKIGANRVNSSDVSQTVDYALCLRDFHSGSFGKKIIPILCSENAKNANSLAIEEAVDLVTQCALTNAENLHRCLKLVAENALGENDDHLSYDKSSYNPTPNIIHAAQELFSGHSVREIGRSDSNADDLERTSQCLTQITRETKKNKKKVICFVTGEPGSGKTLLGLNLAFALSKEESRGEPAALLSGNPPLVKVLQEAIAEDAARRQNITKKSAKQIAIQGLQNLLGFLREHKDDSPPEHVIIYDEAQRAWNAEIGEKLLGREASEPELFLEIMGRLPWAVLVCLVGPGQEINRGEEGLPLWGKALKADVNDWNVITSRQCLNGTVDLPGLLSKISEHDLNFEIADELHLKSNLRAYRNAIHGDWVSYLLKGDLQAAKATSLKMDFPPALVTRDLSAAKRWLRGRIRGGQRAGLFSSSQAVRLIADGIPPSPRSNELDAVAHWFLKAPTDFRSSNSLEKPLTEFVCQGLEIDYGCVCWGHDLIWKDTDWLPRKMRSPKWTKKLEPPASEFRINTYRVLLTRSRAGLVIYVPKGSVNDITRDPQEADDTFDALLKSGCSVLDE